MTNATTLIIRARLFQFHAKYLWRFHRRFVKRHLHDRCVNCVISNAYSALDEKGLCAECRTSASVPVPSSGADTQQMQDLEAEIDRLFRDHAGRGSGAHDAVVMLSGGKDSALLIHELHRRHPRLRILALTIDNSFMSPVALENAARAAERLDVDHVTLKPAKSLYQKSFRLACRLREAGKGCFETVDRIDADLGFSLAQIFAATHRIPLLVSGLSWAQIERIFGVRSFEVPREQALAKVTHTLGKPLGEIYEPSEFEYWWDPAKFPRDFWPRFVHPFYAWRYEEQRIQDRVIKLGLIKPGNDSPLLTNNVIIPMMIVADYLRLGYASFEPEFASQVRAGKADRRFWRNVFEMLEYSARTGWMLDREIEKIAGLLGLTRAEIGLARSRSSDVPSRLKTPAGRH